MNEMDQFLIDFYDKYADGIDSQKIDTIKSTYGDDVDGLINDLYSKYGQDLDNDKRQLIKSNYNLVPSTGQAQDPITQLRQDATAHVEGSGYEGASKQKKKKDKIEYIENHLRTNPDDFANLTPEQVQELYNDDYEVDMNKVADQVEGELLDDINYDGFLDNLVGLNAKNGKIDIAPPFKTETHFYTPSEIMKMDSHPHPELFLNPEIANRELLELQGELSKADRIRRDASAYKYEQHIDTGTQVLNNVEKTIQNKLGEENYNKFKEITQKEDLSDEEIQFVQQILQEVPEINSYNTIADSLRGSYEALEQVNTEHKIAARYDILDKQQKQAYSDRREEQSWALNTYQNIGRWVSETPEKILKNTIQSGTLVGTGAEALTGADLGMGGKAGLISDAYDTDRPRTSKESRKGIEQVYDVTGQGGRDYEVVLGDNGDIVAVYNDKGYLVQASKELNKDLKNRIVDENIQSRKKRNWTAMGSQATDSAQDIVGIGFASIAGRKILKGLANETAEQSVKKSTLKNGLDYVLRNNHTAEFLASMSQFSGMMSVEAIKEGKLTDADEIFTVGMSKALLESASEAIFPFASKITGGKSVIDDVVDVTRATKASKYKRVINGIDKEGLARYTVNTLGKGIMAASSEGLEEILVEVVDPWLNSALNATIGTSFETEGPSWSDLEEVFLVGAMAGSGFGAYGVAKDFANYKSGSELSYLNALKVSLREPEVFRAALESSPLSEDEKAEVLKLYDTVEEKTNHLFAEKKKNLFGITSYRVPTELQNHYVHLAHQATKAELASETAKAKPDRDYNRAVANYSNSQLKDLDALINNDKVKAYVLPVNLLKGKVADHYFNNEVYRDYLSEEYSKLLDTISEKYSKNSTTFQQEFLENGIKIAAGNKHGKPTGTVTDPEVKQELTPTEVKAQDKLKQQKKAIEAKAKKDVETQETKQKNIKVQTLVENNVPPEAILAEVDGATVQDIEREQKKLQDEETKALRDKLKSDVADVKDMAEFEGLRQQYTEDPEALSILNTEIEKRMAAGRKSVNIKIADLGTNSDNFKGESLEYLYPSLTKNDITFQEDLAEVNKGVTDAPKNFDEAKEKIDSNAVYKEKWLNQLGINSKPDPESVITEVNDILNEEGTLSTSLVDLPSIDPSFPTVEDEPGFTETDPEEGTLSIDLIDLPIDPTAPIPDDSKPVVAPITSFVADAPIMSQTTYNTPFFGTGKTDIERYIEENSAWDKALTGQIKVGDTVTLAFDPNTWYQENKRRDSDDYEVLVLHEGQNIGKIGPKSVGPVNWEVIQKYLRDNVGPNVGTTRIDLPFKFKLATGFMSNASKDQVRYKEKGNNQHTLDELGFTISGTNRNRIGFVMVHLNHGGLTQVTPSPNLPLGAATPNFELQPGFVWLAEKDAINGVWQYSKLQTPKVSETDYMSKIDGLIQGVVNDPSTAGTATFELEKLVRFDHDREAGALVTGDTFGIQFTVSPHGELEWNLSKDLYNHRKDDLDALVASGFITKVRDVSQVVNLVLNISKGPANISKTITDFLAIENRPIQVSFAEILDEYGDSSYKLLKSDLDYAHVAEDGTISFLHSPSYRLGFLMEEQEIPDTNLPKPELPEVKEPVTKVGKRKRPLMNMMEPLEVKEEDVQVIEPTIETVDHPAKSKQLVPFITETKNVYDTYNSSLYTKELIDLGKKLDNTLDVKWVVGDVRVIYDGRSIVNITTSTGDEFLMYKSTGTGTTADTKDLWVPFIGFAENGWFIKELHNGVDPKKNKYEIKTFQEIATKLERNGYGDSLFIAPQPTHKYKGIDVVYTDNIVSEEGTKGAAKYTDKQILVDKQLLEQKYKEKAWTNPRKLMETVHGEAVESYAQALPEDQFSTYQEWENFVIEHERQHALVSRKQYDALTKDAYPFWGETTKGDYETFINKKALETLSNSRLKLSKFKASKTTPQQKQYLTDRLEEFNIYVDDNMLEKLYEVFDTSGANILGAVHNAGVILSERAGKNTEKHEAMHIIRNFFLTPEQKAKVESELEITKEDIDKAARIHKVDKTEAVDIALDEKLSDLFENYKAQLLPDNFHKNYPNIAKFFEELFQYFYDTYLIAKSYFKDPNLNELFYGVERNIYGRNFIRKRKAVVGARIQKNIKKFSGMSRAKIGELTDVQVNEGLDYMVINVIDNILRETEASKQYKDVEDVTSYPRDLWFMLNNIKGTKNKLGKIKELYDMVIQMMAWTVEDAVEDNSIPDYMLESMSYIVQNSGDFVKPFFKRLSNVRGVSVNLSEIDNEVKQIGTEDLASIGNFLLTNVKQNPRSSISAELKELLGTIPDATTYFNPLDDPNFPFLMGDVYTKGNKYKYYPGMRYKSEKETYDFLASTISNSLNENDMYDKLLNLAGTYGWVNELMYRMWLTGLDTHTDVKDRIFSSTLFKHMVKSVGTMVKLKKSLVDERKSRLIEYDPTRDKIHSTLFDQLYTSFPTNTSKSYWKKKDDEAQELLDIMSDPKVRVAKDRSFIPAAYRLLVSLGFYSNYKSFSEMPIGVLTDKIFTPIKSITQAKVLKPEANILDFNTKDSQRGRALEVIDGLIKFDPTLVKLNHANAEGQTEYILTKRGLIHYYETLFSKPEKLKDFVVKRKEYVFHRNQPIYDRMLDHNFYFNTYLGGGNRAIKKKYDKMTKKELYDYTIATWWLRRAEGDPRFATPVLSDSGQVIFSNDLSGISTQKAQAHSVDHSKKMIERYKARMYRVAEAEFDRIETIAKIYTTKDDTIVIPDSDTDFSIYRDPISAAEVADIKFFGQNALNFYFIGDTAYSDWVNNPDNTGIIPKTIHDLLKATPQQRQALLEALVNGTVNERFNIFVEDLIKNDVILKHEQQDETMLYSIPGMVTYNGGEKVIEQAAPFTWEELLVFMKEYFVGDMYNLSQNMVLTGADPASFKGVLDIQKRYKQIYAPRAEQAFGDGTHYDAVYYKDITASSSSKFLDLVKNLFKDSLSEKMLNKLLKGYTNNNLTDAGTFITIGRRRKIIEANEQLTPEIEEAFKRLAEGKSIPKEMYYLTQVEKPFASGNTDFTLNNGQKLNISYQHKNLEVVLLPAEAWLTKDGIVKPKQGYNGNYKEYKRPRLAKVLARMEGLEEGSIKHEVAMFESAVKNGLYQVEDLDGKRMQHPVKRFMNIHRGNQTEMPLKHIDKQTLIANQFKKLLNTELDSDFTVAPDILEDLEQILESLHLTEVAPISAMSTGRDLKVVFDNLIKYLVDDAKNKVNESFRTVEGARKLILDMIDQQDLPQEYIDMFDLNAAGNFKGALVFQSMNDAKVEQLINSVFKDVIKQKMTGASFANIANIGYDNDLEIVMNKDETAIEYVEVILPAYYQELLDRFMDKTTGQIAVEDIEAEIKSGSPLGDRLRFALDGVLFRIPTEGKYSMFNFRVKEFSLQESGGTVLFPREVTNISGLDFDADKMFGFLYNINKNLTNVQKAQNGIIHIARTVLSNPSSLKYQLSPGNSDFIDYLGELVEDLVPAPVAGHLITDRRTNTSLTEDGQVGKDNIGIAAVARTTHAQLMWTNVRLQDAPFIIAGEDNSDFQTDVLEIPRTGGVRAELFKMIENILSGSVDHVKDPKLTKMGLNNINAGVWLAGIRLGIDLEILTLLMNSPVMKKAEQLVKTSPQYNFLSDYVTIRKASKMNMAPIADTKEKVIKRLRKHYQITKDSLTPVTADPFISAKLVILLQAADTIRKLGTAMRLDTGTAGPGLPQITEAVENVRKITESAEISNFKEVVPVIQLNTNYNHLQTSTRPYEVDKNDWSSDTLYNSYVDVFLSEIKVMDQLFRYYHPFTKGIRTKFDYAQIGDSTAMRASTINRLHIETGNYLTQLSLPVDIISSFGSQKELLEQLPVIYSIAKYSSNEDITTLIRAIQLKHKTEQQGIDVPPMWLQSRTDFYIDRQALIQVKAAFDGLITDEYRNRLLVKDIDIESIAPPEGLTTDYYRDVLEGYTYGNLYNDLIMYALNSTGWGRTSRSFTHMIPNSFFDIYEENFEEMLGAMFTENPKMHYQVNRLIAQNNHQRTSLMPKINISELVAREIEGVAWDKPLPKMIYMPLGQFPSLMKYETKEGRRIATFKEYFSVKHSISALYEYSGKVQTEGGLIGAYVQIPVNLQSGYKLTYNEESNGFYNPHDLGQQADPKQEEAPIIEVDLNPSTPVEEQGQAVIVSVPQIDASTIDSITEKDIQDIDADPNEDESTHCKGKE